MQKVKERGGKWRWRSAADRVRADLSSLLRRIRSPASHRWHPPLWCSTFLWVTPTGRRGGWKCGLAFFPKVIIQPLPLWFPPMQSSLWPPPPPCCGFTPCHHIRVDSSNHCAERTGCKTWQDWQQGSTHTFHFPLPADTRACTLHM